jgi:hypothetical protein
MDILTMEITDKGAIYALKPDYDQIPATGIIRGSKPGRRHA